MNKLLIIITILLASVISKRKEVIGFPQNSIVPFADTSVPNVDRFYYSAFTYKIDPVSLPDSLGGKYINVTIRLTAWVDSFAHLLSIYPTSIALYKKKNSDKPIAMYSDKIKTTAEWENTPFVVQRYIHWINKILPANIHFMKSNVKPVPGLIASPIKAKNYVPVVIHLK
jgi:hypothetical protein